MITAEPEDFNLVGTSTKAISGSTGYVIGSYTMSHDYDKIEITEYNSYSLKFNDWMIATLTTTYLPITITDSNSHTIAEFTYNQGSYYIPIFIYAYRSSNIIYMRLEVESTISIASTVSSNINISCKCTASNI